VRFNFVVELILNSRTSPEFGVSTDGRIAFSLDWEWRSSAGRDLAPTLWLSANTTSKTIVAATSSIGGLVAQPSDQ